MLVLLIAVGITLAGFAGFAAWRLADWLVDELAEASERWWDQ